MWLFNHKFFRRRIPHSIPRPSELYKRVRAVFSFFGNLKCPSSRLPLFNDRAWQKANNLLLEIALGYASDIPGKVYHRHGIGKDGEPLVDRYGIPLIERIRGTNAGEGIHRIFLRGLRFVHTGPELGDALLTEKRHRYNHRNAERTRPGFPRIFHCDTWLIDKLQLLCENLHLPRPYPTWSNACDFIVTPELTTIGRVHDDALHQSVCSLTPSKSVKLTSDLRFMCSRLGTPLPFLPVATTGERQLFSHLIAEYTRTQASPRFEEGACFDSHAMALRFTMMSDGITIFPKLPVYLRQYHTKWLYSRNSSSATSRVQVSLDELRASLRSDSLDSKDSKEVTADGVDGTSSDVRRAPITEQQSSMPKKPSLVYSTDLVREHEQMPQPVAVPGVSPSQFVRQVAGIQFDTNQGLCAVKGVPLSSGIQFDTNQALCAVKGVPLSKEDQKKACVLCRKAGKQWHESLSCPGRHRNHKRACPLRHHAGGKPAPSASTVNIATQYGEQSTASPSQKRSREEATQGNSTSECSTVRVYFEWYPRSSARMDYMVDAILGKTSMGECVQAFELAAGVHVGQEVHAMVNNVHVFADMPHLLHHSTEWLDMVEEKNDLTQHFVLHVSVFLWWEELQNGYMVHVGRVYSTLSGTAHTYLGGALGMVPYCCKFRG
eukprot:CAMPEP_0182849642 /NCGR_PEP_ID=MMETSP0006_2-20121128/29670_1 /TAXON_ID=97485 /ORGANISM="Prymnesium parvum, Strain Texoma1" /LENGTH=660 /DNA_ID=CAMNT_0024980195 /DNA_START=173 /DNA_END=2153 /DNA_ORIENTATION=-